MKDQKYKPLIEGLRILITPPYGSTNYYARITEVNNEKEEVHFKPEEETRGRERMNKIECSRYVLIAVNQ